MSFLRLQWVVVSGIWLVSAGIASAQVDVRLIPRPAASASDVVTTLPVAQQVYDVGSTFVVEVWAQTADPNGFAQVSLDVSFDAVSVSVSSITHTALLSLFTNGTADNLLGVIDNLSGAHSPAIPACSDAVGAAPGWARVAIINMSADIAGSFTMLATSSADPIFTVSNCGGFVQPAVTFQSAPITINAALGPAVTVALVPRAVAGLDDIAAMLPVPKTVLPLGGDMVVEVWAQTLAPAGLAQVSVDLGFSPSMFTVTSLTPTSLFSLFPSGTIDNINGVVDNLSGSVPPAAPACSGLVGATPQWARVAIVGMQATASGLGDLVVGSANDNVFVTANCGSLNPPELIFLGASITVEAAPVPPVLAAAPNDKPKQKYISIDASVNGARPLAIKVTETTTGKVMWAGAPFNGLNVSNISQLASTPLVQDWSAFSELNLTGCIIQPFGVYEITFVDDPPGVALSSAILPASATCAWGDIQVNSDPLVCDVGIGDIVLGINIATIGAAIPNAHGDVQGDVVNGELDIADIVAIINSATVSPGVTPGGYTVLSSCP